MGEALKYKAEKSKDFLLEIGDGGQSLPTLPSTSLPSAPKPPPSLPSRKAATVAMFREDYLKIPRIDFWLNIAV